MVLKFPYLYPAIYLVLKNGKDLSIEIENGEIEKVYGELIHQHTGWYDFGESSVNMSEVVVIRKILFA